VSTLKLDAIQKAFVYRKADPPINGF